MEWLCYLFSESATSYIGNIEFLNMLFSNGRAWAVSPLCSGAHHSGWRHPLYMCDWSACAPDRASSRGGVLMRNHIMNYAAFCVFRLPCTFCTRHSDMRNATHCWSGNVAWICRICQSGNRSESDNSGTGLSKVRQNVIQSSDQICRFCHSSLVYSAERPCVGGWLQSTIGTHSLETEHWNLLRKCFELAFGIQR